MSGSLLATLWSIAGCQLSARAIYPRLAFAPGAPQTRVLMVGDSLTYYNDLPGLLQQFSVRETAPIYIEGMTFPYAALRFHWDAGKVVDRIHQGHFDYVVLQDFSRRPATHPDQSLEDFARFDTEIRRSGGRTVVFENWTRRDHSDDYPALVQTYAQIAARTDAVLAPIGAAFIACAAAHPDIQLLGDDRHPTPAGSYLAACVLYDCLYHKHSSALPVDLAGPKLPTDLMQSLRKIADQTMSQLPNAASRDSGPNLPMGGTLAKN